MRDLSDDGTAYSIFHLSDYHYMESHCQMSMAIQDGCRTLENMFHVTKEVNVLWLSWMVIRMLLHAACQNHN